jgi:hypothetical protein
MFGNIFHNFVSSFRIFYFCQTWLLGYGNVMEDVCMIF